MESLAAAYLQPLDAAMRDVLARHLNDEPEFGVMLRYALGWEDEQGRPHHQPTGKRLRPLLLLLCAHALDDHWQRALPAAAAVELLHNFSLIHDDIQDASPLRHRRLTVWKVWGIPNAINAGDAMFTLAYAALADLAEHVNASDMVHIWQVFNHTNLELTRGQHLDMRFESQNNVTVAEYISMISGKSAALIATCAHLGAFIASGSVEQAAHFAQFGLNLGIAFQIRDDILGIWGEESVTGKSAATDIDSRKKSLPVLYALAKSPALQRTYLDEQSDVDSRDIVRMLDEVGAREYALEQEAFYYQNASNALEQANPRAQMRPALDTFVQFLLNRQY
ncbi:polyprenyl synthetase family protein [Aggregatilineales bacterium SYSU G02658]